MGMRCCRSRGLLCGSQTGRFMESNSIGHRRTGYGHGHAANTYRHANSLSVPFKRKVLGAQQASAHRGAEGAPKNWTNVCHSLHPQTADPAGSGMPLLIASTTAARVVEGCRPESQFLTSSDTRMQWW